MLTYFTGTTVVILRRCITLGHFSSNEKTERYDCSLKRIQNVRGFTYICSDRKYMKACQTVSHTASQGK